MKVYRRVRAAVLTTGDEVMAPGKRLIPGKIYDCNQGLLAARMKEFGAELVEVAANRGSPAGYDSSRRSHGSGLGNYIAV